MDIIASKRRLQRTFNACSAIHRTATYRERVADVTRCYSTVPYGHYNRRKLRHSLGPTIRPLRCTTVGTGRRTRERSHRVLWDGPAFVSAFSIATASVVRLQLGGFSRHDLHGPPPTLDAHGRTISRRQLGRTDTDDSSAPISL